MNYSTERQEYFFKEKNRMAHLKFFLSKKLKLNKIKL